MPFKNLLSNLITSIALIYTAQTVQQILCLPEGLPGFKSIRRIFFKSLYLLEDLRHIAPSLSDSQVWSLFRAQENFQEAKGFCFSFSWALPTTPSRLARVCLPPPCACHPCQQPGGRCSAFGYSGVIRSPLFLQDVVPRDQHLTAASLFLQG